MPRTVFGGALIKNGYGTHPEEIYVCPRGFNGKYTIRVSNIWADPKQPVTRLTLEVITHEGTSREKKETRNLKPSAENPPTDGHSRPTAGESGLFRTSTRPQPSWRRPSTP